MAMTLCYDTRDTIPCNTEGSPTILPTQCPSSKEFLLCPISSFANRVLGSALRVWIELPQMLPPARHALEGAPRWPF